MSERESRFLRRGRCVTRGKNGDGKAEFFPGSAAGPKMFEADSIAGELSLWWETGAGERFLVGDPETKTWSEWPKTMVINLMRSRSVYARSREGEVLSEANRVLLHVMRRRSVALNALAGYSSGVHEVCGQRILVKTSPLLLEPRECDWSTVKAFIEAKLDLSDEGGPNQAPYFHGWLKVAAETLYRGGPGNFRPGQCCILAGPRDSGKSRLQHQLVTPLLGGRSADPGPYMFGRTDFNAELFAAEHLLMEDPASSTSMKDRIAFGDALKMLLVNDTQRLHRKNVDALTVEPFFRATLSANDDPDNMRALPLLTPPMRDKLLLFRVSSKPLPMPTATAEQRALFRRAINENLPGYLWWLLNAYQIPRALQSDRFGVRAWLHPALSMELFEDTPAGELLQIIDAAQWSGSALWERSDAAEEGELWEGGAIQLERLLGVSTAREQFSRLLKRYHLDRLLARLREDQPERVSQHRISTQRRWRIRRPSL